MPSTYAQRANGFIQNRLAELFTIVKLRLTDADMTQTQGVKLGMYALSFSICFFLLALPLLAAVEIYDSIGKNALFFKSSIQK